MNYAYRLKCRMKKEGFIKTIQYLVLVWIYCSFTCVYSTFLDLRYSGRLLGGNCKSCFQELGANDVYHTEYGVMPILFHIVSIKERDVLVDVGCGKGRVINYWLSKKYKNQIYGLELDPRVANPFHAEKVKEFEKVLSEKYKNKRIKIVYYRPKSIQAFQNGNWKIRYLNFERDLGLCRWGRLNKYHDVAIITPRNNVQES